MTPHHPFRRWTLLLLLGLTACSGLPPDRSPPTDQRQLAERSGESGIGGTGAPAASGTPGGQGSAASTAATRDESPPSASPPAGGAKP